MGEPLKDKTFMNDYDKFPLPIANFPDFEKRRRNSFSYTKDIKSAVEWLEFKLDDVGIYEGQEWQRVADLIREAFPDLNTQNQKKENEVSKSG